MDPEYVAKWVVALSSLFELCAPMRRARLRRGWLWLLLSLLAALALGVLLKIAGTGYWVGVPWLLLVAVPTYALRRREELLSRNELAKAARWARVVARLHPMDGEPERALLLTAQSLAEDPAADQAQLARANALLAQLERKREVGMLAKFESLRLEARWTKLVEHFEAAPALPPAHRRSWFQALGETGNVEAMLVAFKRLPRAQQADPLLELALAAYAGRRELVELIVNRTRARVPVPVAEYYRAIALQASGDRRAARPLLESVQRHAAYERRALCRLRLPLERIDETRLSSGAKEQLARFEDRVRAELAHAARRPRRPWATWALALTLVGVYSVGFWRSDYSEELSAETLMQMGALVLPQDLEPGAWRLFCAGFLHASATHLVLNVLMLLIVGGAIERLWGRLSFGVCFFGASVAAYWVAAWSMRASAAEPHVLLGASAGVFGLVGGLFCYDVVGYLVRRSPLFLRRIALFAVLLGAQFVFDWFTPMVSSLLHFSGAALGALAALPLALRYWLRGASAP